MNGTGTDHATPPVTPSQVDSLVIGGAGVDVSGTVTFTPPAGWTERVDTATGSAMSITIADFTSEAVTTSGTFVVSAADEALTFAVVLNPVVSGPHVLRIPVSLMKIP